MPEVSGTPCLRPVKGLRADRVRSLLTDVAERTAVIDAFNRGI